MKVGSAPGARPGRGEAGRYGSGIGFWLGCGGWGSGISQFSFLVALMAGHAHFFSLQESRLPCLP